MLLDAQDFIFRTYILEGSRIQAGLNAGHTIEGSDWIKTTTGKEKNIAATRREKKTQSHIHKTYVVWPPKASPWPLGWLSVNCTPF